MQKKISSNLNQNKEQNDKLKQQALNQQIEKNQGGPQSPNNNATNISLSNNANNSEVSNTNKNDKQRTTPNKKKEKSKSLKNKKNTKKSQHANQSNSQQENCTASDNMQTQYTTVETESEQPHNGSTRTQSSATQSSEFKILLASELSKIRKTSVTEQTNEREKKRQALLDENMELRKKLEELRMECAVIEYKINVNQKILEEITDFTKPNLEEYD